MVENMKEVSCSSLNCADSKWSFDNLLYIYKLIYVYNCTWVNIINILLDSSPI